MTDYDRAAVLRALGSPLMDDCVDAAVAARGYITPEEEAYLASREPRVRSRSSRAEKLAVAEVLELARLHGVDVDLTKLAAALEDEEERERVRAEQRRREIEEYEARRAAVRVAVAARNAELLAPLEHVRAAATAGWEAMRKTAPNLDGVSRFDELGPKAQFRYLCFAAAALGEPYPSEVPPFVKVTDSLEGERMARI